MITWSATTTTDARHGETAEVTAAWQAATAAALDLAAATGPQHSIAITVGTDTATLYPGFDATGRYDLDDTRAAAQRLVDDRTPGKPIRATDEPAGGFSYRAAPCMQRTTSP